MVYRVEKALSRRALLLENKAYREKLENMVEALNLRLEQSKCELAALNNLVQSYMTGGERTSEAYTRLESAMTAFNSGIESLANKAKDFGTQAPGYS